MSAALTGAVLAVFAGYAALQRAGDPVVSLSRDIPASLYGGLRHEGAGAAGHPAVDVGRVVRSSPAFDFNLIAVAGVLLGFSLALPRPMSAIATALAVTGMAFAAGAFSLHLARFWFPWTVVAFVQVPVALAWGTASCSVIHRLFRVRIPPEQASLRSAFARRLSPRMLERFLEDGLDITPSGRNSEVALIGAVLHDFTGVSERIGDPQRVVEILGEYSGRAKEILFEHDGTIVKNGGDTICAAWGAPLPDASAAEHAIRAAWRISEQDKTAVRGEVLKTLLGLHVGEVVAGNVGRGRVMDFTLIGAAMDLVPLLVGLNRILGTRILMSAAMHARLDGGFRTRRVGYFRFKGHGEVVTVYELLGPALQEREPEWILKYRLALAALETNELQAAIEYFSAANAYRGAWGDSPSRFFMDRLHSGETEPSGVVQVP